MMHDFIVHHREDLLARCRAKVERRSRRSATPDQLRNGIPLFLDQLERTLDAEEQGDRTLSLEISGAAGGDLSSRTQMGVSATAHGKQLLDLGFTVDQVVHDYGDLCQAITDLAVELDAPFDVDEFRTLNRCLDNAIADAVSEFSFQRDASRGLEQERAMQARIGFLVHELRNALSSGTLAVAALEAGNLPVAGATGAVLKRSLLAMARLVNAALSDVRNRSGGGDQRTVLNVGALLDEAAAAAALHAQVAGCRLEVTSVDPAIEVTADHDRVLGAIANLLQNAIKFTASGTLVTLGAQAYGALVLIEVSDHCGGLPPGSIERMFSPFTQRSTDRSGLGLGLTIARDSVELEGGTLTARDVRGTGCVFTLSLPRNRPAGRAGD